MSSDRKLRTCFITFILLASALSMLIILPETAKAEATGETVLYFHYANGDMGTLMDEKRPLADNYTVWPPKLLPLKSVDKEEFAIWLGLWAMDGLTDSELEGMEGLFDGLEEMMEILVGSPLGISAMYEYYGEDTLEINGDVSFNLFIMSEFFSKFDTFRDSIKVSISTIDAVGMPSSIKNKTVDIEPKWFKGEIQSINVILEDVEHTLEPGDILYFSVKIIPGDKPIGDFLEESIDDEELVEILEDVREKLSNESSIEYQSLMDFLEKFYENHIADYTGLNFSDAKNCTVEMIDTVLGFTNGTNVTSIIIDMANALRSSSIVYGSLAYDSSVTLPVVLGDNENYKTYYLHENNVMDKDKPTSDTSSKADLKYSQKWDTPDLTRSKVLTDASAKLFIGHRDILRLFNIGKTNVVATLMYDAEEIASCEKELDKNSYLFNSLKSPEPIIFNFEFSDKEITYDSHLSLEVSVGNNSKRINLFDRLRRDYRLYYDSTECNSYLSVIFEDTDHIQADSSVDLTAGKTVLGGSIVYAVDVTSDYSDNIEITIGDFSEDEQQKWNVIVSDEEFSISAGETKTIEITLESTATEYNEDDYTNEDTLDVSFIVGGKTGRYLFDASTKISMDAVEYDVVFSAPQGMNIKHGENDTYIFYIKNINTGFVPDNYEIKAESEHNFNVEVEYEKFGYNVEYDEKVQFNITVYIPRYTDIKSDMLTVTVISDYGEEFIITVNTTIGSPNVLEKIYQFFEETAKGLGLDDVLGDFAPYFLMLMLFMVLFFIVIIIIIILKKKFVKLVVCPDNVKEIGPDDEAVYEIKIVNPTSYVQNYELKTEEVNPSAGWDVSIDKENLLVEPKSEQVVTLVVKPTDFVKPDDLAEVKVIAIVPERQKSSSISTVTTLKDGKPALKVVGVFHWPKKFKEGQIVKTSFKLENNGTASAENITVVLYVNCEEKNKVEGIAIPRGGYADIEIPWVAVKGKNKVHIEVV